MKYIKLVDKSSGRMFSFDYFCLIVKEQGHHQRVKREEEVLEF